MNTSDYVLATSREYAIYVASHRAIPAVTDGLKHVQRIALWLLRNKSEKIKVVALSGIMAAEKLYVHGDASSNNAISMLAAPYCNNISLIEPHGAFGSRIAVNEFGAARYVSCARSKAAQAFLYNDTDIVPLEDNYDGSNQQPKHFLPLIPVVLLNGISGIAVGWSSNVLPHALRALIEATKQALLNQPIKPLIPFYQRYNITVLPLGPNQWELVGQAIIKDSSTIQITELPPGMSIESFRKRLIALEETDLINNFTDRSTETIDITVKMKRGSITDWTQARAIDFFKLRERITERIVVIGWDGRSIVTYDNPEALIRDFAQWRLGWFTARFEKLRMDATYELTYWLALHVLFEAKFPKRLGSFVDRGSLQNAINVLLTTKSLSLDPAQMDRTVSLPTYRWTIEFAIEVERKIVDLRAALTDYTDILQSPERLKQIYLDELDQLKALKL